MCNVRVKKNLGVTCHIVVVVGKQRELFLDLSATV